MTYKELQSEIAEIADKRSPACSSFKAPKLGSEFSDDYRDWAEQFCLTCGRHKSKHV